MTLERNSLLLDRYRILEILGQGGMGAVYRAMDERIGIQVAVKENLFTTDEYSRQFRREANILAAMRHPNLPRVSDHFEIENQGQYLVMDYIEGEDLRQRMDRVAILPDEEVIITGAAMCDALDYLHTREQPIVHRDIKPGNIKINPHGEVYLVDFGLAKIVSGSQATTTGARAMTPGYSSPEQYGTARTDGRSDIYSLGATLYAALTGMIPEDGLARAMDQTDLTLIRKRNPNVSRRLASVIEKALSIHPEDRYQTANDFKAALLAASSDLARSSGQEVLTVPPPPQEVIDAIKNGQAISSRPLSETEVEMSAESTNRRRRRRMQRVARITGGVLLLAVVVGGIFYLLNNSGVFAVAQIDDPTATQASIVVTDSATVTATRTPTSAVTEPTPTEEPPTVTPTALLGGQGPVTILLPTPTIAQSVMDMIPDRSTAFAFISNRSGSNQIWLQTIGEENPIQLTEIEAGVCQPEWSPDGSRIVFISPCQIKQRLYTTAKLYELNVATGELTELNTPVGSFDPAWSPDGRYLLFSQAASAIQVYIYRYDFETQTAEWMRGAGDEIFIDPAWSPDGTRFVYVSTENQELSLFVMPNEPGADSQRLTYSTNQETFKPDWSPDDKHIIYDETPLTGVKTILIFKVSLEMLDLDPNFYKESRLAQGYPIVPEDDPEYYKDGNWILIESWPEGGNHDIYLISSDGLARIRLTTDEALDFNPTWKP